jgi:ribosome-associated translation inhibitor RaiA
MEVVMELNIVGRNLGITDRFRAYAAEKAEKVTNLTDRAMSLDVKLSRHHVIMRRTEMPVQTASN